MAVRKAKQERFVGELAKPIPHIPRPVVGLLLSSADADAAFQKELERFNDARAKALERKLRLLFDCYKLKFGDWCELALALAFEFVPGFREETAPRGARTRWTPFDTALLKFHIDKVKSEKPRRTFSDAARIVARSGAWNRLSRAKPTGQTLRRRALGADARILGMISKMYEFDGEKSVVEFVRELGTP